MSEQPSKSIYERIGGQPVIDQLIDEFYSRVIADPLLAPFFLQASMDKLRRMQKEFFAAALGGPSTYSGLELSKAHAGRGIALKHFQKYVDVLLETLRQLGIDQHDTDEIIARIATYANDITGESTVDA